MNRLAPDADDARFIRRVVAVIAIGAVVRAIWRAGDLLILAFGSILGAIVIHAVAELYDRVGLSTRAALVAAIVTVLGFLVWLFGVQFAPQVNAFVGALFFAADPKVYERGFLLLAPPAKRPAFEDALFGVGATLRLWLRAQIIGMTTMGVMVGFGLWASGVPSSAALGLLTGDQRVHPLRRPNRRDDPRDRPRRDHRRDHARPRHARDLLRRARDSDQLHHAVGPESRHRDPAGGNPVRDRRDRRGVRPSGCSSRPRYWSSATRSSAACISARCSARTSRARRTRPC